MADNIVLNPGVGGDTIATDDIAGIKFPRTKITLGADGVNDGDVASGNPLPIAGAVTVASLPLPSGAATEATLATVAGTVKAESSAHSSGDAGQMALAVRQDAEAPLSSDGQYSPFQTNQYGRLKVSAAPADVAVTTGSITASAQTVFVQIQRFSNLSISMVATSLVGHNVTFEASNNSTNGTDGNWYVVQVVRSNANTVETASGVLAATPAYMWQVNVSDYQWFRVRATAHTSGTAAYVFSPSAYVSEPVPAIQVSATQPVSGTVTATVTGGTINGVTPTASNVNSAATTNATSVKATAGTVFSIIAYNAGAGAAYVKFYNKASAPTVGTDVPLFVIAVPATGTVVVPLSPHGNRFATGIALAITGGAADTDTTAVAAAQVKVSTAYI